MPISTTVIDIVLAIISFVSCVTSVIMTLITIAKSNQVEFYSRKDKVREIRNEIMKLSKSGDYTSDYVDNLHRLRLNYLDELDGICKRFSQKMIFDSEIREDLIFIRENPGVFSDIVFSPHMDSMLSSVK